MIAPVLAVPMHWEKSAGEDEKVIEVKWKEEENTKEIKFVKKKFFFFF